MNNLCDMPFVVTSEDKEQWLLLGMTPKPVIHLLRVKFWESGIPVQGNTLKVKTVFKISLIHLLDTFKSLVFRIKTSW